MGKSYKLYYFQARGRAEVARLLFAAAGVEYEDVRIPRAEWPKHKAEMPLGQMPVLEVDGTKYGQSKAIRGYLAREFGLNGKNNDETLKIDVIIDTLADFGEKYPFFEKDEAKKAELTKKFFDEIAPQGLQAVEKLYVKYSGGTGFIVGELSVGDLEFISTCDFLLPMNKQLLDCVPKLKALYERVNAVPKIKKWVDKRPKSDF